MNNTAENIGITWKVIDGTPVAHVHVSADMTIDEMRELGRRLYATIAEMEWAQAQLLEVGARDAGLRTMHLVRKAEYEQNHSCPALCGRSAEWDHVYVLRKDDLRGICKKCLSMQAFVVTLHPEQESEGEHGSK